MRARDVEQLLERMRITVPSSIRESERTLAERDRIMNEARLEADRIIMEGKEIARRRTEEADTYAVQVLQDLSQQLRTLMQQVANGIDLMQGGQQLPPVEPLERAERPERRAPRFLPKN